MLKVQNKHTKRIRVVLIIAFAAQLLLTSQSFITFIYEDRVYNFTALSMISFIGAQDATGKYLSEIGTPAIAFLAFPIIAAVALGFQIFDFYYNLKNVVGIIVSIIGVFCVLNFVGISAMGFGATMTLIIYVFTMFMSVMGMMARYVRTDKPKEENKE